LPLTNGGVSRCTNLQSIVLPESLEYIGASVLPDSLQRIGASAFSRCTNLRSIVLPGSLHTIGRHAFNGCKSLQSIVLPPSLGSVGSNAFDGCTGVKVVYNRSTLNLINGNFGTDRNDRSDAVFSEALDNLVWLVSSAEAPVDGDSAAVQWNRWNQFAPALLFASAKP
jgi:hypothetical protein